MHPAAWWIWAAGVVALAGRGRAPVVLGLLAAGAVLLAVRGRRSGGPSVVGYLVLAGAIIAVRVFFYVLVGIKTPGTVVLNLPSMELRLLPGVELLGPVTLQGLATAALGGLQLAVMVLAVGAAATSSSPARLLRGLPGALHHLATAVVIAVGVVPALAEAVVSARRARRLRGLTTKGPRALAETALPVLAGALDRSLALAASMDSRGYARLEGDTDRRTVPVLVAAIMAGGIGTYGLLTGAAAWSAGLVLAVGLGAWGFALGRGRVRRTRLRVDVWTVGSVAVAAAGAAMVLVALAPASTHAYAAALLGLLPVVVVVIRQGLPLSRTQPIPAGVAG